LGWVRGHEYLYQLEDFELIPCFFSTYSTTFDDYFVTSIGDSAQTSTQFWGLLLDYQFTPVGGCQQQVAKGDNILWAYDAFNKPYFLKLDASANLVKVNKPLTFTVTDGLSEVALSDAQVATLDGKTKGTTDTSGKVTLTFTKPGLVTLKATRSDSIRSNAWVVVVAP
jgi:hypothetical protein